MLLKNKAKAFFKIMFLLLISLLVTIGLISALLWLIGYRLFLEKDAVIDWEAFSAIVNLTIPIIAVVVSVYLTNALNQSKSQISDANVAQAKQFKELENRLTFQIENIGNKSINTTDKKPDNQLYDDLKVKALKFVTIAMFTNTQRVADYLDIDEEKAFEVLLELLKEDKKIRATGHITKDNLDGITWISKKKGL